MRRTQDEANLFGRIRKALSEMPDHLAEVFILSHYRGLTTEEIAVEIGVSEREAFELLSMADQLFYTRIRLSRVNEGNGPVSVAS